MEKEIKNTEKYTSDFNRMSSSLKNTFQNYFKCFLSPFFTDSYSITLLLGIYKKNC